MLSLEYADPNNSPGSYDTPPEMRGLLCKNQLLHNQ